MFFILTYYQRQDERAMQLFGLINALLEADDGAQKRHLSIQTFSIIPLSADSGIDCLHVYNTKRAINNNRLCC